MNHRVLAIKMEERGTHEEEEDGSKEVEAVEFQSQVLP
jgi:hypothetical protein